MPHRLAGQNHHVDYLLFGAAFTLQQLHGLLHGLGAIASGILAVAAIVRAVTELVRVCRSAVPPGSPPFRSLCPLYPLCYFRKSNPPEEK